MPTRQELARATLARDDFYTYCLAVHEVTLAPHMKWWVDILQSQKPEHKKVAIAAPPEFWKSRVTRMFIEWSIGRNPEWSRLLAMNTDAQATKQLRSVQETIVNNEMFKLTFPGIKPDYTRGWNQHALFVKRDNAARPEPTLQASGVRGAIQGSHFEEIYTDDVTDQTDVGSPTEMRNQRQWVKGVLYDRFRRDKDEQPIGHWFAIFTRWGEADLWKTFTDPLDAESPDGGLAFTPILAPAVRSDGKEWPWGGQLLWPDEYSDSRLNHIRQIKGSQLYTMTYLCDPSAMGGNILPINRINRFDLAHAPEPEFVLHSWDIATGDSGDASWTVMEEWCKFNRGFMLTHVHRERLTPSKKLNLIYQYRNDRMPNIVLIEDRGPGKEVIQEIEARDTDAMPQLRKTDPKGYGDKVARARAQQSVFERGLIWVPESAPWLADWLDEVSAFPASAFDDQVDAASQALAYMRTEMLPSSASRGPRSWMNRSNEREDDRTTLPPPRRRLRVM